MLSARRTCRKEAMKKQKKQNSRNKQTKSIEEQQECQNKGKTNGGRYQGNRKASRPDCAGLKEEGCAREGSKRRW